MEIIALGPNLVFNSAPFEKVVYNNRDHFQLSIELDDENEAIYEFEIIFSIVVKMIAEECDYVISYAKNYCSSLYN